MAERPPIPSRRRGPAAAGAAAEASPPPEGASGAGVEGSLVSGEPLPTSPLPEPDSGPGPAASPTSAPSAAAEEAEAGDSGQERGSDRLKPATRSGIRRLGAKGAGAGAGGAGEGRGSRRGSAKGAAAEDGERSARAGSGRNQRVTGSRRAVAEPGARSSEIGAGTSFRGGLPLAAKIASFAATLVALLMIGVGFFLYSIAARELDKKINEKGAGAARMLAGFADPLFWWNPLESDDDNPAKAHTQWLSLRAAKIEEQARNLETLVRDPQAKIVFIEIFDRSSREDLTPLRLVASHDGGLERPAVKAVKIADLGEVSVSEDRAFPLAFGGEKARPLRVRRFIYPIKVQPPRAEGDEGPRAPPELKAEGHVYMLADEVDKVRDATFAKVALATGGGILFAIVLSIAVSIVLAAPLRALVSDMKVVARGNLDHKTVARSSDEIGALAHQFNEMTRSLREAQRLSEERLAMENELAIATEIQTKLLPDRIPQIAGVDLFSFYLSAKEVGGDYYDFLVIDQNHLGIVVADVSGKGVPGAMVMTMVRSLLRMASQREPSPAETLKKVNRILAKDIRRGMFVTAIYGVLNVQTRKLVLCSAGHGPMVYYSAQTGKVVQVNPTGIALGFDKGRTFDENLKEHTLQLGAGDRLVLYTDGVIEAMDDHEEEFGLERLVKEFREHVTSSSKDLTNGLVQAIERHRGRADQSDDITIVTLGLA